MRVHLGGRADAHLFRDVFTGPEYTAMLPALRGAGPVHHVVDAGAGIGLFSLFLEHHRRLGVLDWPLETWVLVEPGSRNGIGLARNVRENLSRAKVVRGLVGERTGHATFHVSRWAPWSASIHPRGRFMEARRTVPWVDLHPHLGAGPTLLKMDIEGAEFAFLRAYPHLPRSLRVLIVEYHEEWGSVEMADGLLAAQGFGTRHRATYHPKRVVTLYARAA